MIVASNYLFTNIPVYRLYFDILGEREKEEKRLFVPRIKIHKPWNITRRTMNLLWNTRHGNNIDGTALK